MLSLQAIPAKVKYLFAWPADFDDDDIEDGEVPELGGLPEDMPQASKRGKYEQDSHHKPFRSCHCPEACRRVAHMCEHSCLAVQRMTYGQQAFLHTSLVKAFQHTRLVGHSLQCPLAGKAVPRSHITAPRQPCHIQQGSSLWRPQQPQVTRLSSCNQQQRPAMQPQEPAAALQSCLACTEA